MEGKHRIPTSGIVISIIVLLIFLGIIYSVTYWPQEQKVEIVPERKYTSKTDNSQCLKCHSRDRYEIADPADSTRILYRRMRMECKIDTLRYYNSNHWDFKCVDCHSEEYLNVPHDGKLKYAALNVCGDCHFDDPQFAKYHFEYIDTAFRGSVHYKKDSVNFTCWNCHDPHYNKNNMRDSLLNIHDVIAYDNGICLKCHGNNNNNYYEYFSEDKPDLEEKHSWLPELDNHFLNVRCIDCHASVSDSSLVSHNIVKKGEAIKECNICHSENSLLLKTLYKNRPIGKTEWYGFVNPVLLEDQYVIGSTINKALDIVLISVFGLLILFIISHILLRVRKKTK